MKKKLVTDILFWSQIVLATFSGVGQGSHMLFRSTEGAVLNFFICWVLFSILNLSLAISAYQVKPTRVARQTIIIYGWWSLLASANLIILIWKAGFIWTQVDTVALLALLLSTGVLFYFLRDYKDPMFKGWFTSFFKGIPHLAMAVGIVMFGGLGISGVMILVGHINMFMRLSQLGISIKEVGWDKNRKASFLSESVAEITWIVTTVVWLIAIL